MEKWSGSGNLDWENEKTGDKISPRREDGLVAIDFQKLCTHADKTYCCFCISRLRQVAEVAERLLHTGSLAYVSEDEALLGKYPKYLALVNSVKKKSFLHEVTSRLEGIFCKDNPRKSEG